MATGGGMHRDAETIFVGVQAARPKSEAPQIGRALVRLNLGQPDAAALILRDALQKHPDSAAAMAHLGVALQQAGMRSAAENVLQQAAEVENDPTSAALAKTALEEG